MSKSISLKLDDDIFKETEKNIENLGISRNRFINDAISTYNKIIERKELANIMRSASLKVRANSMEILSDLEQIEDYNEEI